MPLWTPLCLNHVGFFCDFHPQPQPRCTRILPPTVFYPLKQHSHLHTTRTIVPLQTPSLISITTILDIIEMTTSLPTDTLPVPIPDFINSPSPEAPWPNGCIFHYDGLQDDISCTNSPATTLYYTEMSDEELRKREEFHAARAAKTAAREAAVAAELAEAALATALKKLQLKKKKRRQKKVIAEVTALPKADEDGAVQAL